VEGGGTESAARLKRELARRDRKIAKQDREIASLRREVQQLKMALEAALRGQRQAPFAKGEPKKLPNKPAKAWIGIRQPEGTSET
jgi:chromosome segregation ATPase